MVVQLSEATGKLTQCAKPVTAGLSPPISGQISSPVCLIQKLEHCQNGTRFCLPVLKVPRNNRTQPVLPDLFMNQVDSRPPP